jgi:hypothetical protein
VEADMKLVFHRKEQWDIRPGGVKPLLACHLSTANSSTRVFAVWRWGFMGPPWRLLKLVVAEGIREALA